MPEINLDLVAILDQVSQILEVAAVCFGAFMTAFTISLVVWTFRDIRARTHDVFFQLVSTLLVLIFNVLGLLLYLILRPKETLAERHERALAEEALLQDIEGRLACPSCGVRVESEYLLCPVCHTQIKRQCEACSRLNELTWDICPYCGHSHRSVEVAQAVADEEMSPDAGSLFGRPATQERPAESSGLG